MKLTVKEYDLLTKGLKKLKFAPILNITKCIPH